MFFTQDDYKKIQQWLTQNSVKDTEFNEAMSPLNGYETVALVQNGANVKFNIKELLEQLTLLGDLDFINITEAYNERMISLLQAVQLIPYKARKIGQVVTFINEEGKWVIYQYQGSNLSQWNIADFWVDLLQKLAGLDTLIDEEDLTISTKGEEKVIKFKDKAYIPEDFSGLGRVYLRKNLVNIEDSNNRTTKKVNLLTQSMINEENTIYVIQYDYDLNDEEITIPEGCVLDFQGGSLSNGTIVGNNTIIKAELYRIFNLDIILQGTWDVIEGYPEWFGAKGDGETNDCLAIQKCLDYFSVTLLRNITYNIDRVDKTLNYVLKISGNRSLRGSTFQHNTDHFGNLSCLNGNIKYVLMIDGSGIELSNFSIIAPLNNKDIKNKSDLKNLQTVIGTNPKINPSKISIHNVKTQFGGKGYDIQGYLIKMSQCWSFNNVVGFHVHGMLDDNDNIIGENTTIRMDNCYAIISTWHAFWFKGLDYSSFNNLAADGCGHDFKPVNSWDDVRPPYYFDGLKSCSFTTLGAEGCLKMIKVQGCIRNTIVNPFIYYSFHTDDLKGGTYTPGHVFEYISCTDLRVYGVYLSVPDNTLKQMINNNPKAPLYYISDSIEREKDWISVSCYGVGSSWKNYALGGTMKKSSVKLDRSYDNHFSFTSGSFTGILLDEEIDIENNINNYINIELLHSGEINFSLDSTKTIDLKGKTIEITGNQQISAYSQPGHLIVKNGTLIIKGFIIRDASSTARSCYFKAENAKVILENCSVFELNGNYVVDCDTNSEAIFIDYEFTPSVKAAAPLNKYKAYLSKMPLLAYRTMLDGTIIDLDYKYISHGTGQSPKLELVNKYVDNLPSSQDSEHGGSEVITGMIAFHQGSWKTFNGSEWLSFSIS